VGLSLSVLQAHQSSVSQTVSVGYIKSLQHLSKTVNPWSKIEGLTFYITIFVAFLK